MDERKAILPDRFQNEQGNARAHSDRVHLQHFQSLWSYHAHALSSVRNSSLTQLEMVAVLCQP